MTRQEFFAHRARLDFERTHGITPCPPVAPSPVRELTARSHSMQRSNYRRALLRVGQTVVKHPTTEEGVGEVVTRRGQRA